MEEGPTDYALRLGPLESLNEYVAALTAHKCYWDSEDAIAFVMYAIATSMARAT